MISAVLLLLLLLLRRSGERRVWNQGLRLKVKKVDRGVITALKWSLNSHGGARVLAWGVKSLKLPP